MASFTAPRIVTRNLGAADSHTLDRYVANGGYQSLRRALANMRLI